MTRNCAQLVADWRRVMEPNTASRLRVKRKNRLRDFVDMAGPLGVTHMVLMSQTDNGTNIRIARTPKGPTLTFHVQQYALIKDVLAL